MNIIILVKGFVIGLAKIIPGVSGSLVALNMGLYEKGIEALSNYFKDVKHNTLFLANVGIGIIIGILFGSKIILYLLKMNYFLTMISFVGLLIGSNITTVFKEKNNVFIIIFVFLFTAVLLYIKPNFIFTYSNNISSNLFVVLLGFIDACSMIIPCLSGTALFILLGSYDFILELFSNMFNLSTLLISIQFFFGIFIGIIVISKLMNILLNKYKSVFTSFVSGLFLSSILFLFLDVYRKCGSVIEFIVGIILFINCFVISLIFSHKI